MSESPKMKSTVRTPDASYLALILKLGAAMNVELTEATQAVYLEQFRTLSLPDFQQAIARTIREWDKPHMMPPIAYVLARSGHNLELEAECAWEALQKFVYKSWHPDIGFTSSARLDAHTEYAVRQCGGMRRIHDTPSKDFSFIRRDFIAAYTRYEVEGGAQVHISEGEAKNFLKDLNLRMLEGGMQ